MRRPTVILRHCPEYDVAHIQRLATEALERLDLRPYGRTLLKPNVVASGENFPHAHTRAEFMEGVIRALQSRAGDDLEEMAIGERCGITLPTRLAYKGAGFYPMAKRVGVKLYHYDEETQVEIPLRHAGRLRDFIFTPEPVAKADFFVNCPKFKAHPWTTVTFSLKNYIGIQDDRHRLIDHDHKLDEKVADLQYIIQPQFIAIDAIIAGEGRMLTPLPFDMKLMIMGDNQVAFDAVCCHIIGVDPMTVPHIRLAHERGFGPVDLSEIDVEGDLTLAEAQARAEGFEVGLIRVEDYFKDSPIAAYAGPPPGGEKEYCWGGCPGALEEAIEILRLIDPRTDEKMPKIHIVFGAYEGEIPAKPGEKIVFMGDCATWTGQAGGALVKIDSTYTDRSEKSPYDVKGEDTMLKIGKMTLKSFTWKGSEVIRISGCPVSVAEQILTLVRLGKLKNPYFDPSEALRFTGSYLSMRTRQAIQKISGKKYQVHGATTRGDAMPGPSGPHGPRPG